MGETRAWGDHIAMLKEKYKEERMARRYKERKHTIYTHVPESVLDEIEKFAEQQEITKNKALKELALLGLELLKQRKEVKD